MNKSVCGFCRYMIMLLFLHHSNPMISQENMNTIQKLGTQAIQAWQVGESTGNYGDFQKMLSKDFEIFSHPMMGVFQGTEALDKLTAVIEERSKQPNNLVFSNILITTGEEYATVSFDSNGTVMGGKYPYEGHNIIAFKFRSDKIIVFREYFGFLDPEMFKN